MKCVLILLLLPMIYCNSIAQETKVYFGIGSLHNTFQDTRFSNVHLVKKSILPEFGFQRLSLKSQIYLNANAFVFKSDFPNSTNTEVMTLGYNVKLGYLHKVRKHYFGLTWNALDFVTRSNNNLGNSSNFYRLSSDILLSWSYSHALKKNRSLELGLDYGILSFMNTAPSFTANLPQNVIDNGEVSFFDSSTRNPYDLSYLTAKTVHNQLLLNTYIRFNFKKKLSLAYSWKLRSFYDHKSYPVTDAFHTLSLQYNFIRHIK